MTFDKGSLILVDYTAKVKDDDEVFDTTLEADAKKYLLHEENAKYHPKLVSIGETSYPVLKGFDEALAKTSVGDKLTIEVTPDKGFGARDSTKVRMIPLRKLGEDAEKVSRERISSRNLFLCHHMSILTRAAMTVQGKRISSFDLTLIL